MSFSGFDLNKQLLVDLVSVLGVDSFLVFSQKFYDDCHERIEKIVIAIEQDDAEALRIQAHTLGTSAANFGLCDLERLCRKIEIDAEAGYIHKNWLDDLRMTSSQAIILLKQFAKEI